MRPASRVSRSPGAAASRGSPGVGLAFGLLLAAWIEAAPRLSLVGLALRLRFVASGLLARVVPRLLGTVAGLLSIFRLRWFVAGLLLVLLLLLLRVLLRISVAGLLLRIPLVLAGLLLLLLRILLWFL